MKLNASHATSSPGSHENTIFFLQCSFRLPTSKNLVICDVVVWQDTGRLLCTDADTFATFAMKQYGVKMDLKETDLILHIKANMEEARQLPR